MTYVRPAGDLPGPGLEVALDFVNTAGLTSGEPFEDLVTLHDALHWLVDHGVLEPEAAVDEQRRLGATPGAADEALERVRRVRTGLRELIDAVDEERPAATDALAARERRPGGARDDDAGARPRRALRLERRREGTPLDRALAELARRVASEFGEGRPERFRVCGNDRCRWAFYDRSRPGSRRWCEMSSCGNRMKAARHRARAKQKAEPPG